MLGTHLAAASLAIAPAHTAPAPSFDKGAAPPVLMMASSLQTAPDNIPEVPPVKPVANDPSPASQSAPIVPSPAPPTASLDTITTPIKIQKFPDPLEPLNRINYTISQPIDRFILRPVALFYKATTPKPIRDMARNMISNLGDTEVFANDLLQLRPDRAVKTLVRVIINSTLGVGGMFDIAKRKPFNLASHSNSFENTLGYYGIGPIAYLYLPVLGPSSLRDVSGRFTNGYIQNRILNKVIHPNDRKPFFRTDPDLGTTGTALAVVGGLDLRAELDPILKRVTANSVDPYATFRASYLQDRAAEIAELKAKDGEQPINNNMDDPLLDPAGAELSTTNPASPGTAELNPGPSQ